MYCLNGQLHVLGLVQVPPFRQPVMQMAEMKQNQLKIKNLKNMSIKCLLENRTFLNELNKQRKPSLVRLNIVMHFLLTYLIGLKKTPFLCVLN